MELLYELNKEYIAKFNESHDAKRWDIVQVAKTQRQFIETAIDLMNYTIMLDDRQTLEVEGFLVEKIQFMIYDLQNAQSRIKAESRYEE